MKPFILLALAFGLCGCTFLTDFDAYHFHAKLAADGGSTAVATDEDSGLPSSVVEHPDAGYGDGSIPSEVPDAGAARDASVRDASASFDAGQANPDASASLDSSVTADGGVAVDAGRLPVCYTPSTCVPFWTPQCACAKGCTFKNGSCQ